MVHISLLLGGLDEALNKIIYLADQQDVPVVFALGRRALGRACSKIVPVSVVGVFNYGGAEVCWVAVYSLYCISCCGVIIIIYL